METDKSKMMLLAEEVWKDIAGFEGRYQVSNCGRVRSLTHMDSLGRTRLGRIMKLQHRILNYYSVKLSCNSFSKSFHVHRLVAQAFIPNPNNLPQINHKDENPENNNVENLEWCDSKYNINYGSRTDKYRGELHGRAVLSEEIVREIRRSYIPFDKEFGGKALAKKYSVCTSTISYIVRGETWKHLL